MVLEPGAPAATTPEFHVLGPLRVVVHGTEVPIATRRQRALVTLLAMSVGRVVPAERLIDQLWDGRPPPQGAVTLRSYVSNVRQALGGAGGMGSVLVTRGQGYCLEVPPDSVDAVRLERFAQEGREQLRQGRADEALRAFDASVATWGGDPLAEVADHEVARSAVAQLTETYLGALEGRFESLLALGRHADALAGLEAFATEHPLREQPRALLMLALYRAGRTPEALEVHRTFRTLLRDELGLDPSARLDDLQRRILAQDTALAAPRSERPAERTTAAAASSGLVGRDREMSVLTGHLQALLSTGAGALVLLSGEPGIGKTAMLDALERQASRRGVRTFRGRSLAPSGAPAFWPWLQIIEAVAAELDEDALRRATSGSARPVVHLSSTIAERTGLGAGLIGDNPQTLRFVLYEAVSAFLRQGAGDAPVVVTLDDVHWADLPSLELLSYLTQSLATRPLLLVAAYRDLPTERTDALDATLAAVSREDTAHELALAGLRPADVADLVNGLLGGGPTGAATEKLIDVLHERTGGNPFFVRQLARLLLESGGDIDPGAAPVPPGVRHVVARRLADLPESVQALLEGAAVVGRDFDLRTAAAAADQDIEEALDGFDEAMRHGLVDTSTDSGADRRFVHALVQEVVLDSIPAGRAARLHARVADRLEQDGTGSPHELARHRWEARDIVGPAAIPALVAAAEAAASVFAHEQAEAHLRHALELTPAGLKADPSTELALLLRLLRLIVTSRGWGVEEVRSVMDRAMELAHAGAFNDDTARLWWFMYFFLLERNDAAYVGVAATLLAGVEEADREARAEGRDLTAPGPAGTIGHAARAALHLAAIFHALDHDDRDAARAHLVRARDHVEVAPQAELAAFDEHLYVMLLLIEGYWAGLTHDPEQHRSTTNAAIALADADGRPFPRAVARTLAAASGPYASDPAYVHDIASQALDLDHRFGFSWLASLAASLHGWADAHLQGATTRAREQIEGQLADIVAVGRYGNESLLLLLLGDVYALEGRDEDARAALRRARQNPGPYRGLMVDLLDERLARLG